MISIFEISAMSSATSWFLAQRPLILLGGDLERAGV